MLPDLVPEVLRVLQAAADRVLVVKRNQNTGIFRSLTAESQRETSMEFGTSRTFVLRVTLSPSHSLPDLP
ncbi:hypothetical protein NDU88_009050 [Pleurodeles waltl]|uniref:Uncharacterized protein n=1 Tax=Pleurodeles waltl TaxID=8319 RepID=A0AAV7RXG7_PLEWA|nr:hypothetical protein NDU88_009050 [Pleurodeles waltl]